MNYKILLLVLMTVKLIYKLILTSIERRSYSNPIPENVKDVYDDETYKKWREYSAEKLKPELISILVSTFVTFVLICLNAHACFAKLFGSGVYAEALGVVIIDSLIGELVSLPFSYIDTMKIEEKYGFNRSTAKTFWSDFAKSTVISLILSTGLVMLLALVHEWLGNWMALAFAIILFVIVMFISFIYPFLSKIFNKFTPLEEGELKTRLTALLAKYGYTVRAINVMDGSRRSTKSNAYFTGFGKTKTIVLYDTLLASSTDDEICAVFAHEMGHGLNKDTLKNQLISFINIALIAVAAFVTVSFPEIYKCFGFENVNYAFAIILVGEELSIISPLMNLLTSWYSRRAEYRADAQTVKEGLGDAQISVLKKLARQNFAHLSPSPIIVKLTYSHPTISQRIETIEKLK